MWQAELLKKFPDLKMEIGQIEPDAREVFTGLLSGRGPVDKTVIIIPKIPDEGTQAEIRKIVPADVQYTFKESLKPSTLDQIKFIFQQAGFIGVQSKGTGRDLTIMITPMPGKEVEQYDAFWDDISKEFLKDGYLNTWEITCGELKRFFNRRVMEEVAKNSKLVNPITPEDISDLSLALNVTKDVNDFLAVLEGKRPLLIAPKRGRRKSADNG